MAQLLPWLDNAIGGIANLEKGAVNKVQKAVGVTPSFQAPQPVQRVQGPIQQINQASGFNAPFKPTSTNLPQPIRQPLQPFAGAPATNPYEQILRNAQANANNNYLNPINTAAQANNRFMQSTGAGILLNAGGRVAQPVATAVNNQIPNLTKAANRADGNFSLPVIGNVANATAGFVQPVVQTVINDSMAAQGHNPYAGQTTPQAIGNAGIDAINNLTFGKGKAIAGATEALAGGIAKKIGGNAASRAAGRFAATTATTAPITAAYGGLGTLAQNDTNPNDIIKNSLTGLEAAPVFGALHAGVPIIKGGAKVAGKAVANYPGLSERGSIPIDPTQAGKPEAQFANKDLPYYRNPEKAPNAGNRFGQDKEPAGKYISLLEDGQHPSTVPSHFEKGTVNFKKPLVVDFGGGYGEATNWKTALSSRYGGLTGKKLSEAIAKDGHDGIITLDKGVPSEVVSLKDFKSSPTPTTDIPRHDAGVALDGKPMGGKFAPNNPQALKPNELDDGIPVSPASRPEAQQRLKEMGTELSNLQSKWETNKMLVRTDRTLTRPQMAKKIGQIDAHFGKQMQYLTQEADAIHTDHPGISVDTPPQFTTREVGDNPIKAALPQANKTGRMSEIRASMEARAKQLVKRLPGERGYINPGADLGGKASKLAEEAKSLGMTEDQAKKAIKPSTRPEDVMAGVENKVKVEAPKAKANQSKIDKATAKAISTQRNAPAPIELPQVQPGDWKGAILNGKAASSMIAERAKVAVDAAKSLSSHDHALLDGLSTGKAEDLVKHAENPEAFIKAANAAKEYNDYTHALGTGQGQAIKYRENYGASQLYDLNDQHTADALAQYQEAQLRKNPGYAKERLIPNYEVGAKLGLKRLNPNFASDIAMDASKRQRDISELALAKGLEQAYPGQVAVGNLPRGYEALQIRNGGAIAMPHEIARQINKRGVAPEVTNRALKGYDAVNRGLKYSSLGGGAFHATTTAGTSIGQQIMSGNIIKHPIDNLKLVAGTMSSKMHESNMRAWKSNEMVHPDGLSTHDRAVMSGVTLRAGDILGDANVKILDRVNSSKLNFIKSIHDMVFERQIPEAKLMIFEQATHGLDVNKPADLMQMRKVASAVNNFGGVDRAIEGITPRDAQNLSRFVLATDFTETKFRKLNDAFNPFNKNPGDRKIAAQMVIGKALVMAAPGLAVAAGSGLLNTPEDWAKEMAKQILDPQITTNIIDPKTGQRKVAKTPSTEISELGRILLPIFTDKKNPGSGAQHYITARTSAGVSTVWSLLSNKDYFGAPIIKKSEDGTVDIAGTAGNLALSKAPQPINQGVKIAQGKEGYGEAAMNLAGFRVTTPKAPTDSAPSTIANNTSTNPLKDATGTPEAKQAAAAKKKANADAVANGTRLGGSKILDEAQTRIDSAQKTLNPNLPSDAQKVILLHARLSEDGKKTFTPQQTYQLHQAQFQNDALNGKLTQTQQYSKTQTLAKEKVGSNFSPEVVQFANLSRAGQSAMFAQDHDQAQKLYDQAKAYTAALVNAGLAPGTSTRKYSYGSPSTAKLPKTSKQLARTASSNIKTLNANATKLNKTLTAKKITAKAVKIPTAKVARIKPPKKYKPHVA